VYVDWHFELARRCQPEVSIQAMRFQLRLSLRSAYPLGVLLKNRKRYARVSFLVQTLVPLLSVEGRNNCVGSIVADLEIVLL